MLYRFTLFSCGCECIFQLNFIFSEPCIMIHILEKDQQDARLSY